MSDAPAGETSAPRRLDLNESPYPPAPEIRAAVAEAAAQLNRYPPFDDAALMDALAAYAGAPADRIILAAGSNELLHLLPALAGAAPGDAIVLPEPSFPTYEKVARLYRLAVRRVPLGPSGAVDVEAMLAAAAPAATILAIPSPNNPTGGWLDASAIERLAAGAPPGALVHLDEAYYEFARLAGGPETLSLMADCRAAWLVTRSFSKAFGLAGARVGYGIAASADLAARWRAMRPNFNVSSLSAAAARAALAHPQSGAERVAQIAAARERLADGLKRIGLAPLPSAANFLAIPAAELGPDPVAALLRAGLRVAAFDIAGAPYMRATIGTDEDNAALLAALAAIRRGPTG